MDFKKTNSNQKFEVARLYQDHILKYLIKKRKNPTKSKTQYYLQGSKFQYISSLYPPGKTENGKFELKENTNYTLDFKENKYILTIYDKLVSIEPKKVGNNE